MRKIGIALILLTLAGCADAPKKDSSTVKGADGNVYALTDWQASLNANLALMNTKAAERVGMATACSTGFSNAKTDIQFAMAVLGQQACIATMGGGGSAGANPNLVFSAPPEKPKSEGWTIALNVLDRTLDVGLRVLGLRYQRDGVIEQTRANRDIMVTAFQGQAQTAQAGFTGMQQLGAEGFGAMQRLGQSGFTALTPQFPTNTYQLSAGGDIAMFQSQVNRRNCNGGTGAASGTAGAAGAGVGSTTGGTGGQGGPSGTGGSASGGNC